MATKKAPAKKAAKTALKKIRHKGTTQPHTKGGKG
jgi:hypothetical protein